MKLTPTFLAVAQALAARSVCWAGEGRGREFDLDIVRGPRSPRGVVQLPVLFPGGGVGNLEASHPLAAYGMPAPWVWHTYFNDFDKYDAADWTITTTEAGAGSATEALTDADGGVLLVTNDAADNDADFFQKVGESFKYEAGKPLMFSVRFKTSDATQSDLVFGLMITDTTPLDVTDGIYFQKDDGDANIDFHVEKNNVSSDAVAVATLADNTYTTLSFAYDGESKVWYSVNGVVKGSLDLTNIPDDEELTVSFGIQNGEAVAKTLSVDYVFAAKYMGATR